MWYEPPVMAARFYPERPSLPPLRARRILGLRREFGPAATPVSRSRLRAAMSDPPSTSVTALLARARSGDSSALADVFPLIYDELRRLAQQRLGREPDGHTLSPTALVHEAYMRLIDYSRLEWANRAHFMAVASTAMRRILVDHARGHRSLKRGGGRRPVSLDDVELGTEERAELLVAVDEALERLKSVEPRQAQVVECRFFGGMTEEETAEALGIGLRTVKRDWARAKLWLQRAIGPEGMG